MPTIIVEKPSVEYVAYLKNEINPDDKTKWESRETRDGAIGALVRSCRKDLGITIEFKG